MHFIDCARYRSLCTVMKQFERVQGMRLPLGRARAIICMALETRTPCLRSP